MKTTRGIKKLLKTFTKLLLDSSEAEGASSNFFFKLLPTKTSFWLNFEKIEKILYFVQKCSNFHQIMFLNAELRLISCFCQEKQAKIQILYFAGGGRVLPCSGFINACILQGASQAQAPCCSNLKLVTSKKQSTEWYILYFPCTRDILSWKRALAKCASIALCTSFFWRTTYLSYTKASQTKCHKHFVTVLQVSFQCPFRWCALFSSLCCTLRSSCWLVVNS